MTPVGIATIVTIRTIGTTPAGPTVLAADTTGTKRAIDAVATTDAVVAVDAIGASDAASAIDITVSIHTGALTDYNRTFQHNSTLQDYIPNRRANRT